ncbi:hypothetical protein ACKWTF_009478 [Chironomus riparius]
MNEGFVLIIVAACIINDLQRGKLVVCEMLKRFGGYRVTHGSWDSTKLIFRIALKDIARQAIFWNVQGNRTRGRRRITWRTTVEREAEQQNKKLQEIAALAQNRVRFKCFVYALRFIMEQ